MAEAARSCATRFDRASRSAKLVSRSPNFTAVAPPRIFACTAGMSASVRMASRSIILLSQPSFRLELDRILSKCLASPKIERIGLVRPPHIADDDRRKLPPARMADRPRKYEGQPAPQRARRDAVARPRTPARPEHRR